MSTSAAQTLVQNRLAAYINRTTAEMTVNTINIALDAMNMVKLDAQRRANFKQARGSGFIATTLLGAQLSTATSDYAATTPMSFKYIESMWIPCGVNGVYYRGNRVPAMTIGDQKLLHGTSTSNFLSYPASLPPNTVQNQPMSNRWFQNGTLVCVNGVYQAATFWIDGVTYLPPYDGTTATDDFLVLNNHDWLFLASLDYMNLFLKEDQRVQISATKMERLWNSVCANDEQVTEGAFDLDENN